MATIDELMEGKKPGEVVVCSWRHNVIWFQPFFKDIAGTWHGTLNGGVVYSFYSSNEHPNWPEAGLENSHQTQKDRDAVSVAP